MSDSVRPHRRQPARLPGPWDSPGKHTGKNRYIRYTPDIGARMMRSRYLQERLQTIDRAHGFEVWYQPVKCLSTGKFCSLEALLRLREPDGSLISPAEFIPLAEQTGQMPGLA